ncbi:tetratricopeptide repeat protein [Lignipirellula cremea]|uniref:Lipoprotein NlpI n=1 Tax=Lignipirellula cremea TaxID=2528010 RepID=A0A518E024_9BACT|nr:tetratricopeptide repeat protein [Lignipirellula cremea]QDU97435.1 Lipoprotein NlpI precursor [Lignipirellula cremea]
MLVRNAACLFALTFVLSCQPAAEPAAQEPSSANRDLQSGVAEAREGNSKAAVEKLTAALKKDPQLSLAWYYRGRENFRLGQMDASVADFDKYVALEPEVESRQWERGISMYYAGQFDRGAKQFELYQTYHANDVENSVWRYLCMARAKDPKKAQESVLPIRNDPRPAMMEVWSLYAGKGTPEQVLKAAAAVEDEGGRYAAEFYAHLYLGLYHEANGRLDLARRHIQIAADHNDPAAAVNRYMWDVARIHQEQLTADQKQEKKDAAP